MKKVLATALVALMVASTVFAGFSGSATTSYGYNIDDQILGFKNGGNIVKFDLNLGSESVDKKGEGDVYASIKASLSIAMGNGKDGQPAPDTTSNAVAVEAKITEAKVGGDKWSVSILGAGSGIDFASSYYKVAGNALTYNSGYGVAAPGVVVNVFDYTVGFGATNNFKADTYAVKGYFATPEYKLAEGMTLKAGVQGTIQNAVDKTVGFGGEFAYKNDAMSASVATDMGLSFNKNDAKFDADVAASFAYAPVTVNVYYGSAVAGVKNLLSAQVAADLNKFEVPLTITLSGKDLVNTQDLSATVGFGLKDPAVNASVTGGYNVGAKTWNAKVAADYTVDPIGKIFAETEFKGADKLTSATFKAGVTNTSLINGATLGLAYQSGNYVEKKAGSVDATVTIAF